MYQLLWEESAPLTVLHWCCSLECSDRVWITRVTTKSVCQWEFLLCRKGCSKVDFKLHKGVQMLEYPKAGSWGLKLWCFQGSPDLLGSLSHNKSTETVDCECYSNLLGNYASKRWILKVGEPFFGRYSKVENWDFYLRTSFWKKTCFLLENQCEASCYHSWFFLAFTWMK